jgi:hypothetical protein
MYKDFLYSVFLYIYTSNSDFVSDSNLYTKKLD